MLERTGQVCENGRRSWLDIQHTLRWCVKTEGVVGWGFGCCPCQRDKSGSVSGSKCTNSVDDAGFISADRCVQSRAMGVSGIVGKRALTSRPMGSVTLMQFNVGNAGTVFGLLRKPPGRATARTRVS